MEQCGTDIETLTWGKHWKWSNKI